MKKRDRAIQLGKETLANMRPMGMNDVVVVAEFINRGIPASEISPRENVFTYNAWQALGRQVRRGEKGVKIAVIRKGEVENKETHQKEERKFCSGASVFHISQTDPIVD